MASAETATGIRQRNTPSNGSAEKLQVSRVVLPTAEGIKRDKELDKHTEYVPASCTLTASSPAPGSSLVDHGASSLS